MFIGCFEVEGSSGFNIEFFFRDISDDCDEGVFDVGSLEVEWVLRFDLIMDFGEVGSDGGIFKLLDGEVVLIIEVKIFDTQVVIEVIK